MNLLRLLPIINTRCRWFLTPDFSIISSPAFKTYQKAPVFVELYFLVFSYSLECTIERTMLTMNFAMVHNSILAHWLILVYPTVSFQYVFIVFKGEVQLKK